MRSLQEGIYYKKGDRPGQSLGLMFFRADQTATAFEVGEIITRVWDTCMNLKKGRLKDFKGLEVEHPEVYEDLSVLIGYGSRVFDLDGALRKRPSLMSKELTFTQPKMGGGPLFAGSDLVYHEDLIENHAAFDDIVIQFISNSHFITSQSIVEVWHELMEAMNDLEYEKSLSVTMFYDGFRRSDDRNWMGFHDGVSNIKEEERKDVIVIDQSQVKPEENWTVDGTFMGFIRMYIDLQNWWKQKRREQEVMVGRDKVSGCPLIGVNKTSGENIVIAGCPVPGTREVIDKGNERFRDPPRYGFQRLATGVSDDLLKFSHVGEMRISKESASQNEEYRIFRQGYEFLEQTNSYPRVRTGLNFISFQESPKRLFDRIKNLQMQMQKTSNAFIDWTKQNGEVTSRLKFNSFFKVGAAGVFFVPAFNSEERFPGASIFYSANNIKRDTKIWQQ